MSGAGVTATRPAYRGRARAAGRVLLGVCASGAVLSAVLSIGTVADAADQAKLAEAWRGYGYLVFAGIFVLLARRPGLPGAIWLLVIFHKLAMAATAGLYLVAGSDPAGALPVAGAGGVVSVLLLAAYLLLRTRRR